MWNGCFATTFSLLRWTNLSWVVENEGMENTEKRAYEGLRRRARGAFCFGEPNGFHSYNSDLTGAALQGIAAAWEHIITCEDNRQCPRQSAYCPVNTRQSHVLSGNTTLVVEAKRPIETLSIRIPPWCQSLRATIDGNCNSDNSISSEGENKSVRALRLK